MPNIGVRVFDFYLNIGGPLVGGQRKKLIVSMQKIDTGLNTFQGMAVAADVEVMRPGAVIAAGGVITTGPAVEVTLKHPGWLRNLHQVVAIQSGTVHASTMTLQTDPTWNGTAWAVDLVTVSGGITLAADDELVIVQGLAAGRLTLYTDDTGTNTLSQPVSLGASGELQCYVDDSRDVDLVISGSGITTTYKRDVPTDGTVPLISPHDFGATGDGSTDDYIAIQAAIDYVGALKAGGAVQFLGNNYVCNTGLTMRDNVFLLGSGYSSNIAFTPGSSSSFIAATSIDNVGIANIRLTMGGSNVLNCISMTTCTEWLIQNVDISGTFLLGITDGTGTDHFINNVRIDGGSSTAIAVTGSSARHRIIGNMLKDAGGNGINLGASVVDCIVNGNVILNSSSAAIADTGTNNDTSHNIDT